MEQGYIVCSAETGDILRWGTIDAESLPHQAQSGELVLPHDHAVTVSPAAQRIDLVSMTLIERIPQAPPDDEWWSWRWDAEARNWAAEPTRQAREFAARGERDRRLQATVSVSLKHWRLQQPLPQAWADYMQALADVPEQPGFPDAITWPEPPAS